MAHFNRYSFDFLPMISVPLAWYWFGWHGGVLALLLVSHFKVQVKR